MNTASISLFQMEGIWSSGKVVSIRRGYGFIEPHYPLPFGFERGNIFFHFSMIEGPKVWHSDEVMFQLNANQTDKPAAIIVRRAEWMREQRGEESGYQSGFCFAPLRSARSSADGRPTNPTQSDPPRRYKAFNARLLSGRIIKLNREEKCGYLQPLEDLPIVYTNGRLVYFNYHDVEIHGLELEENDILSFSLSSKNTATPTASSVSVKEFHPDRSSEQLYDCMESIIDSLHSQYVYCDAIWQCLGDSQEMPDEGALMLIQILLTLKETLRGFPDRYSHILQVISESFFFDVCRGSLKSVIERALEQNQMHSLRKVMYFLVVVLQAVPDKLPAITRLLKPLVTTEKSSMEYFLYTMLQERASDSSSDEDDESFESLPLLPSETELLDYAGESSMVYYLYAMLQESTRDIPLDVDDMSWEDLPLVPSGKELLMEGAATLQPVRTRGSYDSFEQYMDVYYRLFREDCFSALKKGIQSLLNGNLNLRDMNVYHRVTLAGLQLAKHGSGLALALEIVPLRPVKNWASSPNLKFGNLLCLSVSGSFCDPIWATVSNKDVDLLSKKHIIIVELCTESNDMSDSDAIIQLRHGSGKIIMAESPTYYRAYQPVMRALQKMEPEHFPFMKQLVEVERHMDRPAYITMSTTADTRILYGDKGEKEELLLDAIEKGPQSSMLDSSQHQALVNALSNKVAIVQGPPGTGKTFIGMKLIELILSMSTAPTSPILVLTSKNHALDEFMKDLMQKFPGDVARIGGQCQDPMVQECTLRTLKRDFRNGGWIRSLIRESFMYADEAKPGVIRGATALDAASHFSNRVLFHYATPHQVISLLMGCDWGSSQLNMQPPVTRRTVQAYIEAALYHEEDFCAFMLDSHDDGNDAQLLQGKLDMLVRVAMQQWYPPQRIVHQVETSLGLITHLDLSRPVEMLKQESELDIQLQDEKDIEDMEKESIGAMSDSEGTTTENEDDFAFQFPSKERTDSIRLFSTSTSFISQLPQAMLMNASNLWELDDFDRVKYIQCLLLQNVDAAQEEFEEALADYQQIIAARDELHVKHSVEVLADKKVIGMTITGASINRSLLSALQPAIVLVEEAAEALEPQLVAALNESVQHLILIGDHKQLRPPVQSYDLTRNFRFDVSMMERLIENNLPFATLQQQNRMRPEFAKLLKDIYPDLTDNLDRVLLNRAPACMEKSMFFWTHSNPENGGQSYWNAEEAERAIRLCLFFLQQGYAPKKVTILSAYKGQTMLIRRRMQEVMKKYPELFPMERNDVPDENGEYEERRQKVPVHTIDFYQGDENEIVIVSLVRSNERQNAGFLKLLNRRCVAQSRARCGLYFIGDPSTIGVVDHWKRLIEGMKKEDCVGSVITLKCPRHPHTTQKAAKASDITLSSFCKVTCNEMAACGLHQCKKTCQPSHSHDRCLVPVAFKFGACGHVCQKPCTKPAEQMVCKRACAQHMDCGTHRCRKICGEEHSHSYCAEREEFTFTICGHTGTKQCSQKEEEVRCEAEVTDNHPLCGHLVKRACHSDPQSVKCKQPCIKLLSCGHRCSRTCGAPCNEPSDCNACERIKEEEEQERLEAKLAFILYKEQIRKQRAQLTGRTMGEVIRANFAKQFDEEMYYHDQTLPHCLKFAEE